MILERVLELVFPPRCLCCASPPAQGQVFCQSCTKLLERIKNQRPVEFRFGPQYFDECTARFYYESPILEVVCDFKFNRRWNRAKRLAELIVEAMEQKHMGKHADVLTFVPEKTKKKKHARLLAQETAKLTGIKCECLLEKVHKNKTQHSLSRKERLVNVRGVYSLPKGAAVAGKNVLLIDDIVTTGSTLNECAKVLKQAGARRVCCVAIAATQEDRILRKKAVLAKGGSAGSA